MTPEQGSRGGEEIRRKLANLFDDEGDDRLRIGYREAAAVICTFRLENLRPVGAEPDRVAAAEFTAECDLVRDESGNEVWTLQAPIRIATIRKLREEGRLKAARLRNQSDGPMQQLLDRALSGETLPLEGDLPALRHLLQVATALDGVAPVPSPAAVRGQILRLQSLQPFRDLVGDQFGGRVGELANLANYVGFFPARGLGANIRRGLESIFSIHDRAPLFVFGPGGIGKSTLIAKFILDHAEQPGEEDRFPFAYLDFDRAALTAQEPITLLLEAIRQIGTQYPRLADRSRALERDWRERIAKQDTVRQRGRLGTSLRVENRDHYLDSFAGFINELKLDRQPFLLVLDTFEEVQYRAGSYVSEVFRMLDALQRRVPRTRVVLSGRDFPTVHLDNRKLDLDPLELGEFDDAAALAYLHKQGVPGEELARQIVGQVGRTPLMLRIAAEVWRAEGKQESFEGVETGLLARLRGRRIETQLYTRILKHIHDPEVRQLAHPGLLLRKISPPLIQQVLAGPCRVDVPTLERARYLFGELKREMTLVTDDPTEPETVIHRPDLRSLMLPALRKDPKTPLREIHEAAATFYAGREDPIGRAERLYHLLSLGVDRSRLDSLDVTGLDRVLPISAIRELPPESQAWLAARLPISVDDDVWTAATGPDWERWGRKTVRELWRVGDEVAALRTLGKPPVQPNPLGGLRDLLERNVKVGRLRSSDVARLGDRLDGMPLQETLDATSRAGRKLAEFPDTFEMLLTANCEGWIDKVVTALLDRRPDDSVLYAVAQNLSLTSLTTETVIHAQEQTQASGGSFVDVNVWREGLGEIERRVCRVERDGAPVGTGFLIGRGAVIVPTFLLPDQFEATGLPDGFGFRFDYREGVVSPPVFKADPDWLIDVDRTLDFAIIRVPAAADRGWMTQIAREIPIGGSLVILQHVEGRPLKLSFESNAIVAVDPGAGRVHYRSSSAPGSSGSPCLDEKLALVAMHLGRSGQLCFGVTIDAIRSSLERRGVILPGWEPRSKAMA